MQKKGTRQKVSKSGQYVAVESKQKGSSGRETWRILGDGRERIVTTSCTSTAVMDRAVISFGPALKRLADR